MRAVPMLAVFVALSGCCLDVIDGSSNTTTGGVSSGGRSTTASGASGSSTGGSSSGGSPTGGSRCAGVYCAAFYACDPADGLCKCGGQLCGSGNCDATTGTCLNGCLDGGVGSLAFVSLGPPLSEAQPLPIATSMAVYNTHLQVSCEAGPVQFIIQDNVQLPPALGWYPNQGQIEGVPHDPTGGSPFEFQVEAIDTAGQTAFQNFLLTVQ